MAIERDEAKRFAAAAALSRFVRDGMRLGLGSGSTSRAFVALLGESVAEGLDVVGVSTSAATTEAALAAGVATMSLDEAVAERPRRPLDLAVDGADEIDPAFRMIKGGGASLLREKIVARCAARMVVLADGGKPVARLGAFPLPVEVATFGVAATTLAIAEAVGGVLGRAVPCAVRQTPSGPLITDNGNMIVDCRCGAIDDPERLAAALDGVVGVVEHGLFLTEATDLVVARDDGSVSITSRPPG
jgi:ribose 5-phosphate isomerase A